MKRTRRRSGGLAAVVLAVLASAAAGAPQLTPYAPDAIDLATRRAPPSLAHPFGTDEIGRDLFTRVLYGARVSLAVALLAALMAGGIGVLIGGIAGYIGGRADRILMRATDAALAVPRLLLLMIAGAALSPSLAVVVLLVGAVGWMETARVTRAEVLSLRGQEFVLAARAAGGGVARVLGRHVLVNAAGPIAVAVTLAVGRAVLLESALSFFGVGIQPPRASWGNMLYQAQTTMATEPWLALFPGLFIFVTALSVNAVGDALARQQ
jgi:peptide/nickel transport system permease protein